MLCPQISHHKASEKTSYRFPAKFDRNRQMCYNTTILALSVRKKE